MDGAWFFREWAEEAGRRQSDVVRDLGWQKNTVHKLWYGKQPYSQSQVESLADWLGIEPFELLMRPSDAKLLKRLRDTAQQIAASYGG